MSWNGPLGGSTIPWCIKENSRNKLCAMKYASLRITSEKDVSPLFLKLMMKAQSRQMNSRGDVKEKLIYLEIGHSVNQYIKESIGDRGCVRHPM